MTAHLFIHRFKSGNVASVRLTLPRPGHPVHYLVRWHRASNADDMAEYSIWREAIVADLEHTAGARYRMTDATEERLATA
jgi:hypothetical protein